MNSMIYITCKMRGEKKKQKYSKCPTVEELKDSM